PGRHRGTPGPERHGRDARLAARRGAFHRLSEPRALSHRRRPGGARRTDDQFAPAQPGAQRARALGAVMTLAERFRARPAPVLTLALVVILVLVGLVIAAFSEQAYRRQAAREAGVQAELLASSVTAALAFDDQGEVQAMVNALQVNPRVLAAAVY